MILQKMIRGFAGPKFRVIAVMGAVVLALAMTTNALAATHLWGPQSDVDKAWGGRDDVACWCATAANVLDYTRWNADGHQDATDIYNDMIANLYQGNRGHGSMAYSYYVGTYYPQLDWNDYFHQWSDGDTMLQKIDEYLNLGYGLYLSIGGHAVTCWGYETDDATGEYTHIYITDSDDAAGGFNAEPYGFNGNTDVYRVPVNYNANTRSWELTNYHNQTWRHIERIDAFEPRWVLARPLEPIRFNVGPLKTHNVRIVPSIELNPAYDPVIVPDPPADSYWDRLSK